VKPPDGPSPLPSALRPYTGSGQRDRGEDGEAGEQEADDGEAPHELAQRGRGRSDDSGGGGTIAWLSHTAGSQGNPRSKRSATEISAFTLSCNVTDQDGRRTA